MRPAGGIIPVQLARAAADARPARFDVGCLGADQIGRGVIVEVEMHRAPSGRACELRIRQDEQT